MSKKLPAKSKQAYVVLVFRDRGASPTGGFASTIHDARLYQEFAMQDPDYTDSLVIHVLTLPGFMEQLMVVSRDFRKPVSVTRKKLPRRKKRLTG